METPGSLLYNLVTLRSSDARREWRRRIFERDGFRCVYCGSTENLSIDHVRPRSKGGPTTASNCVTCCTSCNQEKGTLEVHQYLQLKYA